MKNKKFNQHNNKINKNIQNNLNKMVIDVCDYC